MFELFEDYFMSGSLKKLFDVPYNDLLTASEDCARHKRSTYSCMEFMADEAYNLMLLKDELEYGTYIPGPSKCFIVTEPKAREVFAASYRDRVVQHLFLYYTKPLFQKFAIDNCYACFDGRGVLYGQKKFIQMKSRITESGTKEAWCASLDIKSNFCSIDKNILYQFLEDFLNLYYKRNNLKFILWLAKVTIYHDPTENYQVVCKEELWDLLPEGKSLFDLDTGLPIGDITSQLFNNFLISVVDNYAVNDLKIQYYGRYVDDIRILNTDKEKLLSDIAKIREKLATLGLRLNEKKTMVQRASSGVDFIGCVSYNNHTISRPTTYNRYSKKYHQADLKDTASMNSTFGMMVHHNNFNKMVDLYNGLSDKSKDRFKVVAGKNEFKLVDTLSPVHELSTEL